MQSKNEFDRFAAGGDRTSRLMWNIVKGIFYMNFINKMMNEIFSEQKLRINQNFGSEFSKPKTKTQKQNFKFNQNQKQNQNFGLSFGFGKLLVRQKNPKPKPKFW